MAFAAGAMVFPGGRIDDDDCTLAAAIGASAEAVAAIRETIEETAIPAALEPVPDAATASALQQSLLAGEAFGELVARSGLSIDYGALVPFARWLPKFHAVRRFDTLFFVARAPVGDWQPQVVAGECAGASWISAAEVLRRDAAGQASLIFPTRRTLERLALHADFDALAADARAHPIAPISPWVEEREGERFITISEGLGFPVTQEKLDGLWRG
jgi:8-oxo-dGTP pyrophosphatase MutT (NUDIX family)